MRAKAAALLLLLALPAVPARAADDTTDAERLYLETRGSEDHLTQLLGERWYALVKLQDWTDATGKFHTSAKYVEHDPDMKWVKLLAVKGSRDTRVTKEMTIPFEKLDKRCQSRVRQIDHLKSKVEAAIAAATPASEGTAGEQDGPTFERGRGGLNEAIDPPRFPPPEEPPATNVESQPETGVAVGAIVALALQAPQSLPIFVPMGPILFPGLYYSRPFVALPPPHPRPAEPQPSYGEPQPERR